jgi:hypothetical protein
LLFCTWIFIRKAKLLDRVWHVPKLLDRLKCEFEVKTMKEQEVEARSLARNTLGVEGRAWAPRWD